ncbi:MAG: tetratricopeptide repeat protein, partial [Planctomycetia bacterium]
MASDNDNKAKIAADCFKRGSDSFNKGQFDYAIEMFLQATKLQPEKVLYRQSLRGAEYKKYNDNKTGATMASLRMQGSKLNVKQLKVRKKWDEVIVAAEEGLKVNPWDSSLQYEIANACLELDMPDVAVWVMERAVETTRDNADNFRLLADAYEAAKQ